MPSTESNLPTKIDVFCERVGIHSSWAMSASNTSPRLKFEPLRGMKLMLAVATALGVSPAVMVMLISLAMKLGAPPEWMVS